MTTAPIAANDNVRQFYVYQHRRNDTGEIFYIGKGSGKRAWDEHPSRYQNRIWKGCAKNGYTVEIVCDALDEKHAHELEVMLIQAHGRKNLGTGALANLTDGGEGCSGHIKSAETRRKIGDAHRGKTMPPAACAKLAGYRGEKASFFGRKHKPETIAKMSASAVGNTRPLGFKHPPETLPERQRRARNRNLRADNDTGFRGVSFRKSTGRWLAQGPTPTGNRGHLGSFATAEEAARAYDVAAVTVWGAGNSRLNFPAEHGLAA